MCVYIYTGAYVCMFLLIRIYVFVYAHVCMCACLNVAFSRLSEYLCLSLTVLTCVFLFVGVFLAWRSGLKRFQKQIKSGELRLSRPCKEGRMEEEENGNYTWSETDAACRKQPD